MPAIVLLAALTASAPVVAASGGRSANLTVGITALYNSNVARAQHDSDIADDRAIHTRIAASAATRGTDGDALAVISSIETVSFEQFEGLNHTEVAITLEYRVQFERGFFAPMYELSLEVANLLHESALRDGYRLIVGGMMTRRLSDRYTLRAGFRLKRREATAGTVFDLERGNVFASLDRRFSRRGLGYLTYIFAVGDVVSTAAARYTIVDNAEAIEPDTAFGDANRFAYRLDARVHIITIGYNMRVGRGTAIDLSIGGLAAYATEDIEYQRGIARVSLLHRF